MKGREAIAAKWGEEEALTFDQLFGGADALPSAFDVPASHDQRQTIEYKALRCVSWCLNLGVLPPDWASLVFTDRWTRFDALLGSCRDLGEAFGLRPRTHLDALVRDQCAMGIGLTVWKLHREQGLPLKSSRKRGAGALELAARQWSTEKLSFSESTVRQYWRDYLSFLERSESRRQGAENADFSEPSAAE